MCRGRSRESEQHKQAAEHRRGLRTHSSFELFTREMMPHGEIPAHLSKAPMASTPR